MAKNSPLKAMLSHTNTRMPETMPNRMDLSFAFRMPIENRKSCAEVVRSSTPKSFMPSSETAYSSRTTESWRRAKRFMDFVPRDRRV